MAWQDDPEVTATAPQAPAFSDNTRRFLDFIAKAEGADYNTITGGGTFDNFGRHPGVVGVVTKQGPSTAAGRYQITQRTYNNVAPAIGINDFSPESQDRLAIELIRRRGALQDVESGDYNAAIKKLGAEWASLPSSPYAGHPHRSAQWVQKALDTVIKPAYAGEAQPVAMNVSPQAAPKGAWMDDPVVGSPAPTPAPSATSNGSWMDDPVVGGNKATLPDIVVPASASKGSVSLLPASKESFKRDLSLGTRNVLEGVEQAFTYPVRAVADVVAGGLKLAGKNDASNYVYRNIGTGGNAGRAVSNIAGLATPQNRTEEIMASGTKAAAGLLPGTIVNAAAKEAPAVTQGVLSVLMPGTSGSAKEVAKDVATFGGLGAAIDAAPAETAAGLAVLAAGKAGASKVLDNRAASKIIKKAGTEANASMDAEIIRDINKVAANTTQRGAPVGATQLNALENKYIGDVNTALKVVGKKNLEQTGLKAEDIVTAIRDRRIIGADDLGKLRNTDAGTALADAIEKAQRARSLTAPVPASTNPLARIGRATLDLAPIPQPLRYVGQRILGSRQTREDVAQKLISDRQARAADEVLNRVGPSAATQSLGDLQSMAQRAQQQAQARAALEAQAKAAQAAQDQATRIGVLQQTRRPLSGGFQELLPGGRANTNLSSGQAIDALRLLKRQGGPVGEAADQILASRPVTNQDAFYGLQNALRGLQERGVISGQPGALSAASSGVRNPISYAEAVRTAGEAANLARSSAPSKELAQFATKVAGTKTPADKVKLLQDRLAKTTDPAEVSYLTNFIEPLTRFGAK